MARSGNCVPVNPPDLFHVPIRTNDGEFTAGFSANGLCRLEFPDTVAARTGVAATPTTGFKLLERWHELTADAIRVALCGQDPREFPPFDLSVGTAFQHRVWRALIEIKAGATMTYGEIATRLGSPGGARAVGAACGANPIPLLIPCHRVVAAGGALGGFSGDLNWKIQLLRRERAWPRSDNTVVTELSLG